MYVKASEFAGPETEVSTELEWGRKLEGEITEDPAIT